MHPSLLLPSRTSSGLDKDEQLHRMLANVIYHNDEEEEEEEEVRA